MKQAVAREIGKPPGRYNLAGRGWVAIGLLLGAGAALAAEPAQDWASESTSFTPTPLATGLAGAAPAPGSLIEISASNLPRFDNFDGSNRTQQRLDMALLSPGRSSFGVTMGVIGLSPSRYGFSGGAAEGLSGVNLGLQWRYISDSNRRIDITAWRDLGRPSDALSMVQSREAGYGARVEMQLSGSRSSSLVADRGFIGVQLDSGARISLRRTAGKPMIYYRNKF
jgi:hypothetical protein